MRSHDQEQTKKRERSPWPPRPHKSLHSIKNWSPLGSRDVRPHVFIEASIWSTVEATNVQGLFDPEFVFETGFVFGADIGENLRALNGAIAVFHVLCQSRVRPFVGCCCFHVFLVACIETACCFPYVFLVARFTCIFIDSFFF